MQNYISNECLLNILPKLFTNSKTPLLEVNNGKKISKSSGSAVDWFEEESYFFKLSAWTDKLLEHYKEKVNHRSRNLFLGICIGIAIVFFIKPFGKFF